MTPHFRHTSSLLAGLLLAASCVSSVRTEDTQAAVTFDPVTGYSVRAADGTAFPDSVVFGVWAVTEGKEVFLDRMPVTFRDGVWSTDPPCLWPDRSALQFAAFAPYACNVRLEGGSYVLDEFDLSGADRQLYLAVPTGWLRKTADPVPLVFLPATARLDIRVANGLGAGAAVRLEKVVLEGVYVHGSCHSAEGWKTSGEKTCLTVYDRTTDMSGEGNIGRQPVYVGRTLDLIPQQSFPRIRVVYSLSSSDSGWLTGQTEWTEPLKAAWEAERRYTYTLTLTGSGIRHTTGIGSWAGRTDTKML